MGPHEYIFEGLGAKIVLCHNENGNVTLKKNFLILSTSVYSG
jgi:hypothetical protein